MINISDDNQSSEFCLEVRLVQQLCISINTPRSLAVFLMLKHKEFKAYLDLSINASHYETEGDFADDYLVSEVLRKSPNLPLEIDRKEVALQSFLRSEADCGDTNVRVTNSYVSTKVLHMRSIISKILGPLDSLALREIEKFMHHGPGATVGTKGRGSVLSDKFDVSLHHTRELAPFVKAISGGRWFSNVSEKPTIVLGNKFTTVPKNAKTDRGICIEPLLNVYAQLGVGTFLKRRLRKFGINLFDQGRNRALAKVAWDRKLCTIDLSAASDSLATSVVELLLPSKWFILLNLLRSKTTELPNGSIVVNEKFSSMGNGFTFELESLIFAAVCFSCVSTDKIRSSVSVYGDDIIVPQADSTIVIDTLEFLGFRVNQEKSFLAGAFFESCGTDYFKGSLVRPFYCRGRSGAIPYALQLANSVRLYASMRTDENFCDKRFQTVWYMLKKLIPNQWKRCTVPPSLGDVGLITSIAEATYLKPPKGGLEGWIVRYISTTLKRRDKRTDSVVISDLAGRVSKDCLVSREFPILFLQDQFLELDYSWKEIFQGFQSSGNFTYGREPIRGIFGKTLTKRVLVFDWHSGLSWG